MTVNKDIFKNLNLFMQAWTGGVFRIIHFSSSPTVSCIIYHLLTETNFLEVFCCMDLGKKTLLEMFLKQTSWNIIVHGNNLVLLSTRCYVWHMKVGRETSRDAVFHKLLVLLRWSAGRDPSIWFNLSEGCSDIGWSWIIDSGKRRNTQLKKVASYSTQKAWSTCGKEPVS